MNKRKDECQFCTSRSCYKQIYRNEKPKYDEVYCDNHIPQAEMAVAKVLGKGVMRTYRSSSDKVRRGER